jgi:ATP-dependent Lhr-like helicase
MEDAGRVRRGYFVEGLGGAQFGLPGAIDRIRSEANQGSIILAAVDPANPYGASLPWPESDGRASRRAGAHVVLHDGHLIAYAERGGRTIATFGEPAPEIVAVALADLGRRRYRRLTIETINGASASAGPLATALAEAGFTPGYKGMTHRERPQRSRRA